MTFNKGLFVFVGVVVLAAIGYLLYSTLQSSKKVATVLDSTATTTQQKIINTEPAPTPNYTIEEVSNAVDIRDIMPPLSRTIVFSSNIPAGVQSMLSTQKSEVVARLQQDPTRADDWFTLGVIYHTANDYKGAEEVWKFLTRVIPNDTTAFNNLGKLYHFSLPDYPKAETHFLHAIKLDPSSDTAYIELHTLYRYSYQKETTKAKDILTRAISQFPQNIELHLTLGGYYRDIGNFTAARSTFEVGLDKARDAENVALIAQFGQEIERLPAQ